MNNPKTAHNQPFLRRLTLLALPALVGGMIGCGPEQQVLEPLGMAKHEARAPSEPITPALRAAYIANVQSNASHDYALKQAGGVLKAHNAAQRFDVEMGEAVSVRLPGKERLSFDLAGVGCDGELRAVGKATPVAAGNHVDYVRRGGEADDLTEWYVHGPLGLEQGFTLDRPLDCGTREVVIDVGLGGSLAPSIAAQGKAVLLQNPAGRAVARYSDLYVVDAAGRELPSKLVVVGRSVRIRFDERAAVYPVRVDPLVAVEQAKLLASDGKAGDQFGTNVAISGNTAVIGATYAGAAYIFERTGSVWTEQAKLSPSGQQSKHYSVAVDGDIVALGEGTDADNGTTAGAVYIYERVGTGWTLQTKVLASDGGPGDAFGVAVALSGDTLAVGAYGDTDKGPQAGAIYAFEYAGGAWVEQAKLFASDAQASDPEFPYNGDWLGRSVAISGDTIVAGALFHNAPFIYMGAAYVFTRTGTVWAEQAKLLASVGAMGDQFGYSVAISGDTALIGNPIYVYDFTRTGDVWTEQAKLSVSNPSSAAVTSAIDGDTAVLGRAQQSGGLGSTCLFVRSAGAWVEQMELVPSEATMSSQFGTSIAISGDSILVGADNDGNIGLGGPGAAFIFVLRLADGSPCADASECASGNCVAGVCCNTACDGAACEACSIADGAPVDGTCSPTTGPACDDGNACTQVDTCQAGECVGASQVACPPTDDCHDNCNPATGQCAEIAKPDDTPCNDGNACSQQDTCQAGLCSGASTVSCTAIDDCHEAGSCDPSAGVCDNPAKEDGSTCSLGICQSGECSPKPPEGPVYVVDDGCGCRASRWPGDYRWPGFMAAAIVAALRRRGRSASKR